MAQPQKHPLRTLSEQEKRELKRLVKASSERLDVVRRAKALEAVAAGKSFTQSAQQAGLKSGDGVGKLVARFNEQGLAALSIAAGRGRKASYTSEQRALILQEVQREPDREQDATATWSLKTLERALRQKGLPRLGASTIREVLHEHGYSFQQSRTWCRTGYALRKRKSGTVTVYDVQTRGAKKIDRVGVRAGRSGRDRATGAQDEAGPYQAIPQPGASWQPGGHPVLQPHEYERGGTAKLLTLFRPATGQIRAKGVVSVTNAVLHPWLETQLDEVLAEIEKKQPAESLPPEEQRAPCARWETWLGHPPRRPLPALRIVLVLDNLAGHLSSDLVQWFFDHGVMPLYTPVGGSWRNLAESVQRIIVRRALSGQHPKESQQIIDWLEQTVAGWNKHPTPFVWNGKRRRRRKRARIRRLVGSGAALIKGYSIDK